MNKISTLLLSIALSTSLFAAEDNTQTKSDWYVSPLGAYIKSDQSRNTEDSGANIKFGLGKEVSDKFNLELGVNGNWLDRQQDPYLKQIGLELDALYFFDRESVFSPYLATGVGVLDTSSTDDTNATWSAGLGVLTELDFLKDAKLRTELRYQQEFDTSNYVHDDILIRAGVQIPFGGSSVSIAKPINKDSDNDGVFDDIDKCPATSPNVEVNNFGCEVIAPVVIMPLDSDNDGVVDDNDKCPNTPAGTSVNTYGCALDPDDDNDGVANSKDQCPDSKTGVRIDFKGCEIKAVISLPGINFETNSSQLTTSSSETLDAVVQTLKNYPEINAEVAGHTDSTGSDNYNTKLSDHRAAAVRTYLVSKGVSSSRLSSKGYGESNPIATNSTKEGRAVNRRVELKIRK